MTLDEAISKCHVRSAVRMKSNPAMKFWKNHPIPLKKQIPMKYWGKDDWEEYDPRDYDDCSLSSFND